MDARSNVLTQSTTHTPAGMRHLTCSPSVLNGQTLNHSHWRMVLQALAFKARQQKMDYDYQSAPFIKRRTAQSLGN